MDIDDPLQRLRLLQRDLAAFAESRLPNVARLSAELDASIDDLKKLLEKKRKNEASRRELAPNTTPKPDTVKIQDVDYKINDDFRQAALIVADELDLDELEAAKLCIDASPVDVSQVDLTLPYRALLRFHDFRLSVLECFRLVLLQRDNLDDLDEGHKPYIEAVVDALLAAPGGQVDGSGIWRKCLAGLAEVEGALKKVDDHKQTAYMTGQVLQPEVAEAMDAQRLLLTRQHECLAGIMSVLPRVAPVAETECRELLSKAASLEGSLDIAMHYLPIMVSASTFFGSDAQTPRDNADSIYKLFAPGPGQLQWRQPNLKAAATVCWIAEYSSRFADPTADPVVRVADRQKAEQERADLFLRAVHDKGFHFMLAACKFAKPEVWHDPAKVGLVGFLLADSPAPPVDAPLASEDFAALLARELQVFTGAFVGNMPDVVRRLKNEEDDQRRLKFSLPATEQSRYEPDLERFIVIMSYAFQDDQDAAQDFWLDPESNLYGFLRWVSQRLPTPRVAAFCELLRSIAGDAKSANQAHRFLLEDTAMVSGKLRKTYSVSWAQIFAELDTYANSVRERPAVPQAAGQDGNMPGTDYVEGVETIIMLEAYLRLASHVCRTSPDARNWLLRGQAFHLGENMTALASSGIEGRIQASCLNMLSAMLTDKVSEVNDGMWALLEHWISGGGAAGSNVPRPPVQNRPTSERYYLQRFNDRPETATAFVALLNALITPSAAQADLTLDALPFPENLGGSNRHAGIDAYVDFAIGTVFRLSQQQVQAGSGATEISVLRYTCLEFIFVCLSTFNEDLVLLANTTGIAVDSAIETSSLATYARLHPFARVMEWLFNNNVITILFITAQQSVESLNVLDEKSPQVQATLKAVQVMNLAMRLQATYFDIVRPVVKTQSASRSPSVANPALASFDEVMLSQLGVAVDVASFVSCTHADLSLESLALLQKLSASRKLSETADLGSGRGRIGNRLISVLSGTSDSIAMELTPNFQVYEIDIETGEVPLKLVKAQATLDMLNSSLDASSVTRPTVAHVLLGFHCNDRTVDVAPQSTFAFSKSLFHTIAACAAQIPVAFEPSNLSWLLSIKRGCLDVLLKLALSPLTARIVRAELREMEFIDAESKSQIAATLNPLWDYRPSADPETLLDSSALAIRDFLRIRELFFQYAALELRNAADMRAYSVQERAISTLRGLIRSPTGDHLQTMSVFDLFDFLDVETAPALDVSRKYLADLDLAVCTKDDPEILTAFDLRTAEELFILRKRELVINGTIKDASEEQQLDDEIRATMASLTSQNNWRFIQNARVAALEAWTDLLSLMITSSGLEQAEVAGLALEGLQVILPKFERSLSDDLDSAALLAKLTLALVPVATQTLGQQNATAAHERLLSAFRVCLRTITNGDSGLALRDVCYRICCAVIDSTPLKAVNGKHSPLPHAKQLLQIAHTAGDPLLTVITEDAFSGRGSTCVSAVLFLDALVAVFQAARVNAAMLKALAKLNFVPVLIDSSIGSVASSFQGAERDLTTTLAYFHTALALLLRICRVADGTQLVLNSGFFAAITDSRLFSTDPDIGLDIDNPIALREFYKLLSAVLRVVTAIVVARGPSNAATLQQAKTFLQQNRFSMQAVFKRTSAVQKTAGPPEMEAMDVATEFSKLMLVTGFLQDDEPAQQRTTRLNGFTLLIMENSPLARLAPELRNRIYELVFEGENVVSMDTAKNLNHPLTMTCRQVRDESLLMYYSATRFRFFGRSSGRLRKWLRALGREACASIKALYDCWCNVELVSVERINTRTLLWQGQGLSVGVTDLMDTLRPGVPDWEREVHKTILGLGLHTQVVQCGGDCWIVVMRDANKLLLREGGSS
ncbi:hypothetical protein LTR85_004283 [Meristemomyces frigidus]|nr:hypothetical protein LTR85_004283 [Meristemomyces frigidus]